MEEFCSMFHLRPAQTGSNWVNCLEAWKVYVWEHKIGTLISEITRIFFYVLKRYKKMYSLKKQNFSKFKLGTESIHEKNPDSGKAGKMYTEVG